MDPITKKIYQKHYEEFTQFSNVTSSYWQEHDPKGFDWVGEDCILPKVNHFADFLPIPDKKNFPRFKTKFLYGLSVCREFHCSHELFKTAQKCARLSGRLFELCAAKQALSLDITLKALKKIGAWKEGSFSDNGIETVCVIGDGMGYLSALLRLIDPKLTVISVNLGRVLFYDSFYLHKIFPKGKISFVENKQDLEKKIQNHDHLLLEAEHHQRLEHLPIDLFFNICSMQEMNMPTVHKYFDVMRASSSRCVYFYSCNRAEKKLPGGEISREEDYPWKNAPSLFNEPCPWLEKYPASEPGSFNHYDSILHRLVKLK